MRSVSEQTPQVIDAELARLHALVQAADTRAARAQEALHRLAGHRQTGRGQRTQWNGTAQDAQDRVRSTVATMTAWDRRNAEDALARIDQANADREQALALMRPLDDAFSQRPWNRFFLVPGGHVHATLACRTLRATTNVSWLPDLSGLSEADAVAAHGTVLCTHCFPTAPVEWTRHEQTTTNACAGSGTPPVNGSVIRRAYSTYGQCSACGTEQVLTSATLIRKHKTPKEGSR